MKKMGILLLIGALMAISCGKDTGAKEGGKAGTTAGKTAEQGKTDLSKETSEYKKYVEGQIDMLLKDTENFAQLLKTGKLDEAKKVYPLIRMAYERSEPIAESFGESDIKIDYRLVDFKEEFKNEEGWKGFHRIEKILWEQNTTKGTEKYAEDLVNDIKELKAKIATIEVTPDLMVTGAIDLLNEVSTQKITGEEEVFSHTDLYDFRANIEGAQKIFELFRPKLEQKDAKLVTTLDTEFKAVNALLDKYMTDDKNYKLYTELKPEDTKALAEAVTKLGEPLSQMGIVIDATPKK
ncbi:Imelysin [Leptotrichia wadei]|jgi:periplasmic iron transport lipoprotein, putative|uniref:Periplasmic iron transport lipoprotein n=2 Tax=Leptotrichia TaxID=32067 RepID=A0A510JNT2_9FUSO|nr:MULTISPECIES: iron uptake system protein EfeO [Leptotrichia]KXB59752.1 Imelysin [Leptotrichia wadei]BBM41009.1 periplasmic iron transport lipoprotein [Leptotrichia shahii]VTX62964.1 Iron uptake system component EfeO [uncultured Leptotrichia sp.]